MGMNSRGGRAWAVVPAIACGLAAGVVAPASAAETTAVRPDATRGAAHGRTSRSVIPGTRPPWAVAADLAGGPVRAGSVRLRVYLAGRDPAGLAAYAAAVSDPASRDYRRYLTPGQARARFGPAPRRVAALRAWLTAAGLRVTGPGSRGPAGEYLTARGTLRAAGRALAVGFARFRGPGGRLYRAPREPASLPRPLTGAVLSVSGLDTAAHVATPDLAGGSPALAAGTPGQAAPPCSAYFGEKTAVRLPRAYGRRQPWRVCGYVPSQVRAVYGVTASGMTGRNQAAAIVDAYNSPTIRSDAARYARVTGDPPLRPGQYASYQVGPFTLAGARECGEPADWHGEQTLDVEALHGIALNASIRYVAAASCRQPDMLAALALIVNRRIARIVSDSLGWPASDFTLQDAANAIFEFGAAEGIGFFFSAGDKGYNSPVQNPGSARRQVQYPTSSPWVTSVGGTSLAIGAGDAYLFETSWGTLLDPLAHGGRQWRFRPPGPYPGGYDASGGGGVSIRYRQPWYQRGVVPARLARKLPGGSVSRRPMRVVPDIAAVANSLTGLLVGQTTAQQDGRRAFGLSPVGGTSLACPVIAGIEADAQQRAGFPLGFANPLIYARYGTTAFRDVTDHPRGVRGLPSQVIKVFVTARRTEAFLAALGVDGEGADALRAVRGYDDATGVGSPYGYIDSVPGSP